MTINVRTGRPIFYVCADCGNLTRGLINNRCPACYQAFEPLSFATEEKPMHEPPQPISTAPRDGTRVLVFVPGPADHHRGWLSARWETEGQPGVWLCGGHIWSDEAIHLNNPEPTHWMPLPDSL